MLDNIVCVSGIHSCGKSTFVRALCSEDKYIRHKRIHQVDLEDTYTRAVWRLTKYYIEVNEQIKLSKNNPDKIIVANRCVYDNFSYMNGFFDLNWVTQKQLDHHKSIYGAMFLSELRPKNVIFLCPPLDWVKEKLKDRWKTKKVKWREDNFEYLETVYNKFIEFYDSFKGNLLILKEKDLEKKVNITKRWIYSSKNEL